MHAHGSRHAEAHRAEAGGTDPAAWSRVQELGSPHLVLAHIGGDVRLGGQLLQHRHHFLGGDIAFGGRHHQRVVLLPAVDALQPGFGASCGVLTRGGHQQGLERVFHIGHHRHIRGAGLAELSGVDVDMDHLGPRRKAIEAAGDAVVEAGAGGDQ